MTQSPMTQSPMTQSPMVERPMMEGRERGLTVRWSLTDAPMGVEAELAEYVATASLARFEQLAGLRFKTWRLRPREWFEGLYVFASADARADFQAGFEKGAAESPVSNMVGSAPVVIEPCEIVGVAEGPEGLVSAAPQP